MNNSNVKNRIPHPLRFSADDNLVLTDDILTYFINENQRNMARYKKLDEYYQNETEIQSRTMSDHDKPNNRISHAFARYISKISTAYFMGLGIRYDAKPKAYKKELDKIISGNITNIQHFEEAKEMANCGISYELLFINPSGELKSKFYKANEIIPIFGQTPKNYLSMAIRPYKITSVGSHAKEQEYIEVYDKQYISTYKRIAGAWKLEERFSHNLADVPVIIRCNNYELKGDYEDIIPLIDAYDKAQSDTSNDLDYFSDAYLNLEGLDSINAVDEEGNEISMNDSAKLLRESRLLFTPAGCKAQFITKAADDTQSEHHKDRLRGDIFFLSQVPNLTDESFAGNLSGVAIKYKLFGLEELVIEKETYFTSSELKKVRIITDYINKLKNTSYDWRTVTLKFDRSAVSNTLEIAQIMNLLRDILSNETLLGMFPEVEDVTEELQRKLKETLSLENSGTGETGEAVF